MQTFLNFFHQHNKYKKMKILKLITSCIVLLFTACDQKNNSSFPEDLMYNGNPIHPACITQTQDGDSRLEPHKIYSIKDTDYIAMYENLDYQEIINETSFDPEAKTVTSTRIYTIGGEPMKSHDQYQYIGSYKGKHIIKTRSCEVSSRRIIKTVTTLGLIKRRGDTIQNIGTIAYDAYDQGIEIHSFSKNIIRFSGTFSFSRAIERISDNYNAPGVFYPVSLIFEANLDDPPTNNMEYESKLVGLILPDTPEDSASLDTSENTKVWEIIHNYTKSGKRELNLEEAKNFAQEVTSIFDEPTLI